MIILSYWFEVSWRFVCQCWFCIIFVHRIEEGTSHIYAMKMEVEYASEMSTTQPAATQYKHH
jgi:hypothetical protein